PPPPPPPPPPAPPASGGPFLASTEPPKPRKEDQKARSALLADIQHGTRLRKVARINDRSAPQIEKSKGPNRDGGSSANTRSAQPSLGGLFAGGFPVLRPAGQRDMTAGKAGQLPGVQAPLPRPLSPMNNNMKTCSNLSNPPDGAKAANPWEPASALRAGPTRPSLPTPPLPPPPSSKPSLTFPSPPSHPPPTDRPAKLTPQNFVSPPLPPPPPQCDKPAKFQASAFHPPPPPPPLPLTPPYGLPVKNDLSSSSPSPQPELRDYLHPTPPPPPPPLFPPYTSSSTKPSLPLLPSPAPSRDINSSDVPPPLPPKSPYLLSQFQKPNIQSMPPELRDYLHPTPPPPPPPLFPPYTSSSTKPSLPLLPSPAPSRDINSSDVPPPLPPKSPYLLSQFQKPNIQSMPLPPTPPFPQPSAAAQKRRPGRVAVSGVGKLPLPPQPPARSPTTELTSKSPYAQAGPWPAREPSPQFRNGNMPIVDDFESKFTFHSVEDFPPPDEFKPFQRIYPSKEPRDAPKNPLLRTHVR
ncbi:PREDICTED: WAS/WASL-interacting protein family member 3, partial [Gavialis gangeticus]|uniref:WAS/WASL-interacting protein family member 3 n=1 Tax=Gavialis gangeticus TaxID=94835 RepID=UPI00092F6B69